MSNHNRNVSPLRTTDSTTGFHFPDITYSELDRMTQGDFDYNEAVFDVKNVEVQEKLSFVENEEKGVEEGEAQHMLDKSPRGELFSNYRYFVSLESARHFCDNCNRDEFNDAQRTEREKRKQAKKLEKKRGRKRMARKIFPIRLHELASSENFQPLNWADNGTLLAVDLHTINPYLMEICRTTRYSSFLRQLHLYGFRKVGRCAVNTRAEAKLALYQHPFFQKDKPELLNQMERTKL